MKSLLLAMDSISPKKTQHKRRLKQMDTPKKEFTQEGQCHKTDRTLSVPVWRDPQDLLSEVARVVGAHSRSASGSEVYRQLTGLANGTRSGPPLSGPLADLNTQRKERG